LEIFTKFLQSNSGENPTAVMIDLY